MSALTIPGRAPRQNFIVLAKGPIVGISPGLAVVKKAGTPRNWSVMQGYGADGASLVYAGAGLSEFDVDVFLWKEPEHWLEWELFALLLAKPIALPLGVAAPDFAIAIQHPILNAKPWEIERVVVKDVSSWDQDDKGMWATTISFHAYRRPKPVLMKPREGPTDTDGAAPVPKDPAERMIADLQAKNAGLAARLK